ncbi:MULTISPECIES: ATP-binding protein [unclassified Crossiella]|uniref:ATP-binding protein n=1 Tax=unclassified Crossiella TaxID=2620835 RepID=UPI001FFFD52F|nr:MULTISPECIES: ATP-binding protein [unclassified Crossiella]MCK2241157.1 putative DNA binding domain-containing protein [Crossiella sp. S99.2]MCK2253699.1 putative DNA binding domain-containing protein [Crossiella sp. S99.1]
MDAKVLTSVIDRLRRLGGEPSEVEVKSAAGGLPKSILPTLSAFANTNGGLVILGLDEQHGFAPVKLAEPVKLRDDLASQACADLEPRLPVATDIVEFEDHLLVTAEISPLPSSVRPCYVSAKGISTGSYVRVGDGDRRMTQAEIGLAFANREQPAFDREPVGQATLEDLDRTALLRTIQRVRQTSRAFLDIDELTTLERLRVLVRDDRDALVPSLGGLLTFGVCPQQFFPQLMISVAVHPATEPTEPASRFIDSRGIRGAIPDLVADTIAILRHHMTSWGSGNTDRRSDRLGSVLAAVCEAVVNALLHRDYSPITRGTQVQLDLYADRLEIRSPGSLYGTTRRGDLGKEGVSSSRNGFLASLLTDVFLPGSDRLVAENRASGIPAMIRDLQRSGLAAPVFRNFPNRFEVEFRRATRRRATAGGGKALDAVAAALRALGSARSSDIVQATGLSRPTVADRLNALIAAGQVEVHGATKSPRRTYYWLGARGVAGPRSES